MSAWDNHQLGLQTRSSSVSLGTVVKYGHCLLLLGNDKYRGGGSGGVKMEKGHGNDKYREGGGGGGGGAGV